MVGVALEVAEIAEKLAVGGLGVGLMGAVVWWRVVGRFGSGGG